MNDDMYGIRWMEFNKRGNECVTKERFFKTDKARGKFLETIEERDGFYEIVSYCDPVVTH
jgi:hypothetical protein